LRASVRGALALMTIAGKKLVKEAAAKKTSRQRRKFA
jgi:hypothetical protein